jgi:hypothetical protein
MALKTMGKSPVSKIRSFNVLSDNVILDRKEAAKSIKPYSRFYVMALLLLLPLTITVTTIIFNSEVFAQPADMGSLSPLPPVDPNLPTIEITSPEDDQQVPPGELTIQGISSDDEETECQVFADVNDITPMRNVTAVGSTGQNNDFSKWTFTYTQNYQLIKPGENELTAKITCLDGGSSGDSLSTGNPVASNPPLSEWHTINVTGAAGASPVESSQIAPGTSADVAGLQVDPSSEADNSDVSNEENNDNSEEAGNDREGSTNSGLFDDDPFFD